MNRLDRLLTAARDIAKGGKALDLAIIDRDGAFWRACAHLWDGVTGHSETVDITVHATQKAAVEHIHGLKRAYPGQQDTPIIIIDV